MSIKVRVSEQGGVFKEVELNDNATGETALKSAGARTDVSKEIRVNNEPAVLDDMLDNGDTVFVIPQVKGN